jgi:hypothetical protein
MNVLRLILVLIPSLVALAADGQASPPAARRAPPAGPVAALETPVETIVVGEATPSGSSFTIRFQDNAAATAAPLYTAAAPENARVRVYDTRQVLNVWQGEVQSRLDQLFPHGVPAAAKAKIKIKVTIKLSKPPEIGISIEW